MSNNHNIAPSSVRLQPELKKRLIKICDAKKIKPTVGMAEAIEAWVSREELRVSLRDEARAAHDHFVATGLHLTELEADAWMEQLENGINVEPPKCHV